MTSTAVAKTKINLPALAPTSALDIDSGDIALPRLKLGQPQAKAVQDETVPAYSVYSQNGPDDDYPVVLWKQGDEPGVLFHVLSVTRRLSVTIEGELFSYELGDPAAPKEAWVTYNYVVCLPEVDADVPYKLLLTRTGASTAKQINTVLKRAEGTGPAYLSAFRLTAAKRENDKGRFAVPRAQMVEATNDGITASSNLAEMIGDSSPAPVSSASDEPGI